MVKIEEITGAWTLIDWRIVYADDAVTHPFGADAKGYIIYAANGLMSASICTNARAGLSQRNARSASTEQKAAAFDSYFHYAGAWRLDGHDVVHDVTMALNPDMNGTQQRRHAMLDDEVLTLSAEEGATGGTIRHHILRWRRC